MDKLAKFGGKPVQENRVSQWPEFDEREVEKLKEVIYSGQWGGYPYPGPQNRAFITNFLKMQGGDFAVTMANGSVTLEVACRAAGIGWQDEVLVPAYTFVASAAAPVMAGAVPVFVDISPETCCIDPAAIEQKITKKTRAIIVVHLGSQVADMDAIMEIAERYKLIVIEDCAHAHGAKWRGKGVGTIGHFGSFSFQSFKTLTTGEGGILICKTKELAEKAASIMDCGRPHDAKKEQYTFGSNYRMTELQAALGLAGLERFDKQADQRERMVDYLEKKLAVMPGIGMLKRDPRHTKRSVYSYIFHIKPEVFGIERGIFCDLLNSEGISCDTGYEGMHQNPMFQPGLSNLPAPNLYPEQFNFDNVHLPVTEEVAGKSAVWLDEGNFRGTEINVDNIVKAIEKIYKNKDVLCSQEI